MSGVVTIVTCDSEERVDNVCVLPRSEIRHISRDTSMSTFCIDVQLSCGSKYRIPVERTWAYLTVEENSAILKQVAAIIADLRLDNPDTDVTWTRREREVHDYRAAGATRTIYFWDRAEKR